MNDLEICEAVCLYCSMRFSCTLTPSMCADCQDYIKDNEENLENAEQQESKKYFS